MPVYLSSRLQPLRSGTQDSHLYFVPQTLTTAEIVQIILIFVLRQLLRLVGLKSDVCTFSADGEPDLLPDLSLSMPFYITRDGVKHYSEAVGLSDVSSGFNNSAQLCLLLSAFSEPAMLLLLASHGCPILPLGAVNVKNRFEILMPRLCTEEALLTMRGAELRARVMPKTRRVKRGLEIDLQVNIVNLAEGVVIFRQVFTMLQFVNWKSSDPIPKHSTTQQVIDFEGEQAPPVSFDMSLDAPMKWARICMDYNVLHISTLAARVCGFPGLIAHGNHVLALGTARLCLEGHHPDLSPGRPLQPVAIEVHFLKPVTLPATLSAQMLMDSDRRSFTISRNRRTCVVASMRTLPES